MDREKWKIIRTVIEAVFLFGVLVICAFSQVQFSSYKQSVVLDTKTDGGFLALSYMGVDRLGDEDRIGEKDLDEQLGLLKENGFETVTQEQIRQYYEDGKSLPPKALFLIFEDGRKDTVLLADPILVKYNYKATILTYGKKLEDRDYNFIKKSYIKNRSFWEVGCSGYRMEYINCYDGSKNHYLMDFIRDRDGIPQESGEQMQNRIAWDYKKIKEAYEEKWGETPKLYVLLHSNSGMFGNNRQVSNENEKWMYQLFSLNFNRIGSGWNNRECSPYNLTRLSPRGNWSTNKLIQTICLEKPGCIYKREEQNPEWKEQKGVMEHKKGKIIMTSDPDGVGNMRLANGFVANKCNLSVKYPFTDKNKVYTFLRCNVDNSEYLRLYRQSRYLILSQKLQGADKEQELWKKDVGTGSVSVEWKLDGMKSSISTDGKREWQRNEVDVMTPGSAGIGMECKKHQIDDGVLEELYISDLWDDRLGLWSKFKNGLQKGGEWLYEVLIDSW